MRDLHAALLVSTLLAAALPRGATAGAAPASPSPPPPVELQLTDPATGRAIFSGLLREGERAVLTWTNSLFRLPVTEVFVVRSGRLELTSITYGDPSGASPPRVRPEDVDDLYQTGGPFFAEGLAKPVRRVIYRVGEVGHPVLRVGDRVISFLDEVGFGGAILLSVK